MCYFVIGVLQPIQIAKETTVGVWLYITVTSEYLQRYPEVQQKCFMKDLVCNLVQILNCNLKKLIVHAAAAAAAGDHVSRPGSWERQPRHLHRHRHFRNFCHFCHFLHFRQQIIFILALMARVMGIGKIPSQHVLCHLQSINEDAGDFFSRSGS